MRRNLKIYLLGFICLGLWWQTTSFASECWMGERFGIKGVNYEATNNQNEFDADTCLEKCAPDMRNALQICHRLGAPYINNAEFGCFYRNGEQSAELLASPPPDFFGCTELCDCPKGNWYEVFRRRCVAPTGTAVPNMPNGDKGGGYFVKDGFLFQDASEADCRVLPSGQPQSIKPGSIQSGQWTSWMNLDAPSGHGDIEGLQAFIMNGTVCPRPIDIQCRTKAGVDWLDTGQIYTCHTSVGGVCTNFTQADGDECQDYEVRFLCP